VIKKEDPSWSYGKFLLMIFYKDTLEKDQLLWILAEDIVNSLIRFRPGKNI
jgi:hypothetical protein